MADVRHRVQFECLRQGRTVPNFIDATQFAIYLIANLLAKWLLDADRLQANNPGPSNAAGLGQDTRQCEEGQGERQKRHHEGQREDEKDEEMEEVKLEED